MTTASNSIPARPPAQPMSPITIAFLFGLVLALSVVGMQAVDTGQQLAHKIYHYTGLAAARGLDSSAWLGLLTACAGDQKCSPWLARHFQAEMAGYWYALLCPVIFPLIALKFFPPKKVVPIKDPGLAHWETRDRMKRFFKGNDKPEDPFMGFMGYLKSGSIGGSFDAKELPAMYIPLEDWCQNSLIWGGIRSGKTTSFFQPNIFLAAHLNVSCIVFDVKWPQKDSGFFETLGYWYARNRSVVLFSPFERCGARLNLLAGVNSFSDCLSVADAVFPPPEFQIERGAHYNEKKRFMIASMVWLLRTERGDEANFRDVLDHAMLPDDRLMEWVESVRDSEARRIILGYREAGESKFAEDKNGIISALKVFFNENVAYNTSGLPAETVAPEDCFRQPTLTLVAVNMEDQLDGSGEVLFRLYKRMLDKAAMRVAREQGGRLKNHLAIWLDELPSIGRLNYMMRSMGALRSFNMSHHLGIQNDAQSQLVYGDIYWKAISTNVVARVIMFPRGINGDDARKVSETIGKTTATEVTVGGNRSIDLLTNEGSNSVNSRLVERYLLAFEEFADFSLGEAVVRMNGQHPIRTQLVPMGMKTIEGTGIKPKSKPNVLYPLFEETVARCPGGLVNYTSHLIDTGVFRTRARKVRTSVDAAPATPKPVPASVPVPVPPKPAQPTAVVAPSLAPVTSPVISTPNHPVVPAVVSSLSTAEPSRHLANLPVTEAVTWLERCMQAFCEITFLELEQTFSVKLSRDSEAVNGQTEVTRLFIGGLLDKSKTGLEARLKPQVMKELPGALLTDLKDYPDGYRAFEWLAGNACVVSGTPEYQQAQEEVASSGGSLRAPVAQLEGETLIAPRTITREIFRVSGSLRFPTRRIGSLEHDLIPVGSLAQTAQAVREARAQGERPAQEGEGQSRRQRKKNVDKILASMAASPESPPQQSP